MEIKKKRNNKLEKKTIIKALKVKTIKENNFGCPRVIGSARRCPAWRCALPSLASRFEMKIRKQGKNLAGFLLVFLFSFIRIALLPVDTAAKEFYRNIHVLNIRIYTSFTQ